MSMTADDGVSSSYDEVHQALFDRATNGQYYKVWGAPGEGPLPVYKQTLTSLLRGLLPFGKPFGFLHDARRTVGSRVDLRWGADRKGFRRLLHPMGLGVAGTWKIDAAPPGTAYTGYFAKGAEGRIIGRYSSGGSNSRGGHYRSLALVGKIYPPAPSPNEPPAAPANFFAQEDLGTTLTDSIREALLTNSPPVSPWNRGKDAFQLLFIGMILTVADKKNSERQLYEIAELEKPADQRTSCPRFMRLTVAKGTPPVGGAGADFRDEILGIIYDPGNPLPQRLLAFDIDVSDEGKKHGLGIEWLTGQHWTRIGSITITEAAASYNGDFVIHFHHPVWRNDRNDPNSVARRKLRS